MRPRLLLPLAVLAATVPAAPALASPFAATGGVRDVTTSTVTLTGTVNPRGVGTSYFFQYGTTTKYGVRTPARSAGNVNARIGVSIPVSGLGPNTVYHYRLIADGGGRTIGGDRTFRTRKAAPAVVPEPSKLELERATISPSQGTIDILAPITARASGSVSLELFAAGQVHRWTAPIDSADGRIRNVERIPAAQAKLGTGILTILYGGDPDTRPQVVRLRAANRPALLDARRPTITAGRLQASGTVSTAARGVVRVQLEYFSGGRDDDARVQRADLQRRVEPRHAAADVRAAGGDRGPAGHGPLLRAVHRVLPGPHARRDPVLPGASATRRATARTGGAWAPPVTRSGGAGGRALVVHLVRALGELLDDLRAERGQVVGVA